MLSTTQLSQVGNFDESTINNLRKALRGGIQALAAPGALDLTQYVTELSVDGTDAFTLAAPTVAGQQKRVVCVGAANTPIGTLTVSSPDDTTGFVCSSTFIFDTVGQSIDFVATTALKWRAVRIQRAGGAADAVVVGTTVLTGYNLWLRYCLSVTGTVNSTTTKGLPNGSAVGERCIVTCSTAALSPIGSISGTFIDMIAAAYTVIGAVGVVASTTVVGDCAVLEWTGAAWSIVYMNGCTLS
jgi:hypothetical protein